METASTAQPTEQCVQRVRFTSILPAVAFFSCAVARPIMLNGSWAAKARRRGLRARRNHGNAALEGFLVSGMAL